MIDYSIPYPDLPINSIFSGNTSYYWSSTTFANYPQPRAWVVSFPYGQVGNFNESNDVNYVRCVQGGQAPPNNFTANNGTVTDQRTGLVWQQQDDGQLRSWEGAIAYCESLSLDNQSVWRVPNVKELESINDESRVGSAIDPAFTGTKSSEYWTSTTNATTSVEAWVVNFYYGGFNYLNKSSNYYVRCVSGGTSYSSLHLPSAWHWTDTVLH